LLFLQDSIKNFANLSMMSESLSLISRLIHSSPLSPSPSSSPPLTLYITTSIFHSRLKTNLFHTPSHCSLPHLFVLIRTVLTIRPPYQRKAGTLFSYAYPRIFSLGVHFSPPKKLTTFFSCQRTSTQRGKNGS